MGDSTKQIGYEITAENAQFVKAMEGCANAVSNASNQIKGQFASIGKAFEGVQKQLAMMATVVAGGAAFKAVIGQSAAWAGEAGKLSKALGITTEQASVMNVALNRLGLDSDLLVSASQKMSKQIFSNGAAFETMGVKVRDSTGQYRPVTEVMGEVNAKLLAIKNPIEQNIAGQQAYGKGWAEVKGILRLTSEQMAESEKRARELGLIVGPEGVANAKAYKDQMRDLNLVSKSLEIQFGNALLPVFTRLGKFMSEEGPIAGKTFGLVIEAVGFAASATWLAIKDMGQGIGAIAAQGAALLNGDLAAFRMIGAERDKQAAENAAAYERLKQGFGKPLPAVGKDKPDVSHGPTYNFKPDKDKAERAPKADKSRMSEWEAELATQKAGYELQNAEAGNFHQFTLSQELAFWEQKQAAAKTGTAEVAATQKKASDLRLQILRKGHETELQIDGINIESTKAAALARVDTDEQAAQLEVSLGNRTKAEMLAMEQGFEDRRQAIRGQALQEKFLIAAQDPERNTAEMARIAAEVEQLEIQHQAKLAEIRGKIAVSDGSPFSGMFKSIESGWGSLLAKMAQGQMTLAGLMRGLFQNTFQVVTQTLGQLAAKWVAQRLGLSALEKMLMGEQAAAQGASTAATIATKKVEAATIIPAEASIAAGGAAAAVAGIPLVGPALAAAAFAETMAMVMGGLVTASAAGGYDIPAGVNPVVQTHAREMILPARYADVIRGLSEEGNPWGGTQEGGGNTVHYHDHSGRLSKQAIRENAATIASEMARLNRNFIKG